MATVDEVEARIGELAGVFEDARTEMGRVLVGQRYMVDSLLVGLLANGHVLIEGVPGLAKTTAVKALAQSLHLEFSRIQFTPGPAPGRPRRHADLPSPVDGTFTTRRGPVFANVLLADEINRSPAKVQSALLEAMQERQVTIGDETFAAARRPFLVLATQNPLEQEGTYPLPEAQVDRFLLKLLGHLPIPRRGARDHCSQRSCRSRRPRSRRWRPARSCSWRLRPSSGRSRSPRS